VIEETGERAAFGARVQRLQAVARRVAGKGRAIVEAADLVGAFVARQPEIRNAVGRVEPRAAGAARPVFRERAGTGRTG